MARHTWITLARQKGVAYDIIQACVGHANKDVTDVYMEYSLEQLDQANSKVME